MRDWEQEIVASPGDNSTTINAAISLLSIQYGGGTIFLYPTIYKLASPIIRQSNITIQGAFNGGHIFDASVSQGTILRWIGPVNGTVLYDVPAPGDRLDNGGVQDLSIDGAGVAGQGLRSCNCYYPHYARIHCIGVKLWAYYFGTIATQEVRQNYHARLDDLTAFVQGPAHGIVLDGVPGSGRNTCFLSARNCHVTHEDGVAYALSNCDDCGFLDCAASMVSGKAGVGIYFGGSSDGGAKAAYGNRFVGWKGNSAIVASGGSSASRGNYVLTNAVDGISPIYQSNGATMTVDIYDGEAGYNGLVRNPLKNG